MEERLEDKIINDFHAKDSGPEVYCGTGGCSPFLVLKINMASLFESVIWAHEYHSESVNAVALSNWGNISSPAAMTKDCCITTKKTAAFFLKSMDSVRIFKKLFGYPAEGRPLIPLKKKLSYSQ